MSSNNVNLGLDNNILKFLDNHFILEKIIESKLNKEDLNTLKKEYLAKTRLFNKQKELANEKEIEELTKTSELISKQEEDTKSTIKGFLNLIDNFRKIGNFDTSALIHKKIVNIRLTFIRLTKLQQTKYLNMRTFYTRQEDMKSPDQF